MQDESFSKSKSGWESVSVYVFDCVFVKESVLCLCVCVCVCVCRFYLLCGGASVYAVGSLLRLSTLPLHAGESAGE